MKGREEKTKRNFGGLWHSDMSYAEIPPLGSALYARVIPPYGGDTMWTNMYRAYDALSDTLKSVLEGLHAVHSPVRSYGANGAVVNNGDPAHKMDVRTDERAMREAVHPVVRAPGHRPQGTLRQQHLHPALRWHERGESAPLLQYLHQHAARPSSPAASAGRRARWPYGTTAVPSTAMNDYDGFDRELHRTTIAGTRPVGVA